MDWFKWRPSWWPWREKTTVAPRPTNVFGSTWFPPHELFKSSLEMHYSSLTDLHESVLNATVSDERKLEAEFDRLRKILPPGDDHLDSVIDDVLSLQTRTRWSALLHAVAAYHYLECEIVLLMRWRLSGMTEKDANLIIRQVHVWDRFKDMTKVHLGTQLSALPGFTTVDELRVVCNAAKHTAGLISTDLANRKGKSWKVGEPIDTAKLDLPAYRQAALGFLSELVRSAEAGVTKQFGASS